MASPIFVTLSKGDVTRVLAVARQRRRDDKGSMLTNRVKNEKYDGLMTDQQAAGAECAVARYFELEWSGAGNTLNLADVGGLIDVRHTLLSYGKLILREDDRSPADRPHVLVVGALPRYELVGWFTRQEALLHPDWRRNPNMSVPAFFVPRPSLYPLEHLWVWLELQREAARG